MYLWYNLKKKLRLLILIICYGTYLFKNQCTDSLQ